MTDSNQRDQSGSAAGDHDSEYRSPHIRLEPVSLPPIADILPMYEENSNNSPTAIPKLDRSISDIYQDQLYNPSMKQTPEVPKVSTNQHSLPNPSYSNVIADRLEAANQGHLSARPHFSTSMPTRDPSPFRQGFPFYSYTGSQPLINQVISTGVGYETGGRLAPPQVEPRTISPKEAMLDFNEEEESTIPLFPSNQPNSDAWQLAFDGSSFQPTESFTPIETPTTRLNQAYAAATYPPPFNFTPQLGRKREQDIILGKTNDGAVFDPVPASYAPQNPNSHAAPNQATTAATATQQAKPMEIPFIRKLYNMLEDRSIQHLISWSSTNDSFVMSPTPEFAGVLDRHFKHGNIASFVRQLNMYGFHKVYDTSSAGALDPGLWEFKHDDGYFKRGDLAELRRVRRRASWHSLMPITADSDPPDQSEPPADETPTINELMAQRQLEERNADCSAWLNDMGGSPDLVDRGDDEEYKVGTSKRASPENNYENEALDPFHILVTEEKLKSQERNAKRSVWSTDLGFSRDLVDRGDDEEYKVGTSKRASPENNYENEALDPFHILVAEEKLKSQERRRSQGLNNLLKFSNNFKLAAPNPTLEHTPRKEYTHNSSLTAQQSIANYQRRLQDLEADSHYATEGSHDGRSSRDSTSEEPSTVSNLSEDEDAVPKQKSDEPWSESATFYQRISQTAREAEKRIGQAQFKCNEPGCGMRFTGREDLKRHTKRHSKATPYACWVPGCHQIYRSGDSLDIHYTKAHSTLLGGGRYVSTLDPHSRDYDPDFRGQLTDDGRPIYGSRSSLLNDNISDDDGLLSNDPTENERTNSELSFPQGSEGKLSQKDAQGTQLPTKRLITSEDFLTIAPGWRPNRIVTSPYPRPAENSLETYYGRVENAVDAVILCEACRVGLMSPFEDCDYKEVFKKVRVGSVVVRRGKDGITYSALTTALLQLIEVFGSQYQTFDWVVIDPEGETWNVTSFVEMGRPLKRPSEDNLLSLIHPILQLESTMESNLPATGTRIPDGADSPNTHDTGIGHGSIHQPEPIPSITPDSGYASAAKWMSKRLEIAQAKSQTGRNISFVVQSTEGETEEAVCLQQTACETESVYSDISAISQARKGYLGEFADELVNIVQPYHLNDEVVARVTEALPDLLKSFALSLGHASSSPVQREIMVFIHRYRRDIVTAFKDRVAEDETESKRLRGEKAMSLEERMELWNRKNKDPPDELQRDLEEGQDADFVDRDEDMDESELPGLGNYRQLIQGTPTYRWLLSNVHRECILFTPGRDGIGDVRRAILKSLPVSPRVSRQKFTEIFNVSFRIGWDPSEFLLEEEYEEEPGDAIEGAITFTGSGQEVQAETCGEYMRRTWPSTGAAVMKLIKSVVSGTPTDTATLSDGTRVDITCRPSEDSGSLSNTWIDARGSATSIAEIGEQVAWLACALRSSPQRGTIAKCRPLVEDVKIGHVSYENDTGMSYIFDIGIERQEVDTAPGDCWRDLVAQPAIVEGYPIRRRPIGSAPGLEMPLHIMARLVDSRKLYQFDGRTVLKGFSTILVPTEYNNDIISWHLVRNDDDKRISYLASEKFPAIEIPIEKIEKARHILGWCPEMKFYAGAVDANYSINDSRLPRRCGLNLLKDVSISTDHSLIGGAMSSIGRKDTRVRRNGYISKIRWISQKYITLWDVGEERGWLVNGASALLHLVRASFERDKSDPALRSVYLFKEDELRLPRREHHPEAALEVLLDPSNQTAKVYPEDESYITFKDRVEDFYDLIEKMYDYQVRGLDAQKDGSPIPRSLLEGWDFRDLALERDTIYPRQTALRPEGLSWVDFTRSISAVTLFGRDFGDIVKPIDICCPNWSILKPHKSYLAAAMVDLNNIMAASGDPYSMPLKLTHDIVWHIPASSFASCQQTGGSTQRHSTVVQNLLPSRMRREFPNTASKCVYNNGAIIFGFNKTNKWFWGDSGHPSRTPIQSQDDLPGKEAHNPYSDDSGLGNSLGSSTSRESISSGSLTLPAYENPRPINRRTMSLKTENPRSSRPRGFPSAGEYKVGIVCALHIELMAVRALFDQTYPNVAIAEEDPNYYALGRMGEHNVVAVCLPHGVYGTSPATDAASNMRRSFRGLKFCLLVGIGAGVPSRKNDIRLGDVVISTPSGRYSGVLPYDMIKSLESGASQLNGYLSPPPQTLMCAISELESDPSQSATPLGEFLQKIEQCKEQYKHPGVANDQLFASDYIHPNEHDPCEKCDSKHLVKRPTRESNHPRIFYGLIASGNQVMRSAEKRDMLAREHNVLCFEMEGAGIMNNFPCLIIRGICDYADSHKSKMWQNYASAAAAAYAKLLLLRVRKSGELSTGATRESPESSRKRPLSEFDTEVRPAKRISGVRHVDEETPVYEGESDDGADLHSVHMESRPSESDEL